MILQKPVVIALRTETGAALAAVVGVLVPVMLSPVAPGNRARARFAPG